MLMDIVNLRSRAGMAVLGVVVATILAVSTVAVSDVAAQPNLGKKAKQSSSKRVVLDRVVAVVNDAVVLESDLYSRILPLLGDLQNIADERERARRQKKLMSQILEEMISEELIVQAAKEAKLKVERKEITAAVEEVKKQNKLDDSGLSQALAQQGFTIESYKRDVERQLLRMRSVNMLVRPRVTITDEDVRARYDEMGRRMGVVSKVRLRHVLISLPPKPTEKQVARAKALSAEIIEKAKGGTAFADLAKQYSDDQATKDSGGDLGWIERTTLPTEWEVVVFSMDKGDVRGPVSGKSGLHVFYAEDLKKSDLKSFDELKEQLRNELYRKEMDKQTALWLEELRKKAYIERKL